MILTYLAPVDADPDASPARREAVDIVFQAFNRYLGVAVGLRPTEVRGRGCCFRRPRLRPAPLHRSVPRTSAVTRVIAQE
jgi:hypothetical protein